MFEYKARVLLNLFRDAQRQATVSFSGASTPVTDRLLLESAATQARSLEGRPLAMYRSCSPTVKAKAVGIVATVRRRIRRTEATDARPQEVKQRARRVRRRPTLAHSEEEEGSWISECSHSGWSPPRALLAASSKQWPAVSNGFFFDSPNQILLLCF